MKTSSLYEADTDLLQKTVLF